MTPFDRRLDVGDSYETRWFRITVDFQDADGESIDRHRRRIAIEDEATGEILALTSDQAFALGEALLQARSVLNR